VLIAMETTDAPFAFLKAWGRSQRLGLRELRGPTS
jgi:hypothetical protein